MSQYFAYLFWQSLVCYVNVTPDVIYRIVSKHVSQRRR